MSYTKAEVLAKCCKVSQFNVNNLLVISLIMTQKKISFRLVFPPPSPKLVH